MKCRSGTPYRVERRIPREERADVVARRIGRLGDHRGCPGREEAGAVVVDPASCDREGWRRKSGFTAPGRVGRLGQDNDRVRGQPHRSDRRLAVELRAGVVASTAGVQSEPILEGRLDPPAGRRRGAVPGSDVDDDGRTADRRPDASPCRLRAVDLDDVWRVPQRLLSGCVRPVPVAGCLPACRSYDDCHLGSGGCCGHRRMGDACSDADEQTESCDPCQMPGHRCARRPLGADPKSQPTCLLSTGTPHWGAATDRLATLGWETADSHVRGQSWWPRCPTVRAPGGWMPKRLSLLGPY